DVTAAGRGAYPEVEALGVTTVRVDVGEAEAIARAVEGHDAVFHAAARAGVWGPRADFVRTNVTGTANVIEACRRAGVPRLVFTRSPSVVFGDHDHENGQPDLPHPERFQATYPATKAAAERLVLAANGASLATVALRPHLIWGPRDPHLLPRIFARA